MRIPDNEPFFTKELLIFCILFCLSFYNAITLFLWILFVFVMITIDYVK